MDLGPISGIRSISLLNAQKAQVDAAPHFEIDASARPDDERGSKQQTPDRKPEKDAEFVPQAAAVDQENIAGGDSDSSDGTQESRYDWFV